MLPLPLQISKGEQYVKFGIAVFLGGVSHRMQYHVDVSTSVCSEATTYFLLDFYVPHASLTGIVVIWNSLIGEEGEDVVMAFVESFFQGVEVLV